MICLVYVDDTLLFAPNVKDIDDVLRRLKESKKMQFGIEDEVAGFLRVNIDRSQDGAVTLTQCGLTDHIIEALHIEDLPAMTTPATECLGKDMDGDPALENSIMPQ